jgi:hypothetical protein
VRIVSVIMPMVNIRKMWVIVSEVRMFVAMLMRTRAVPRKIMFMQMMLIVDSRSAIPNCSLVSSHRVAGKPWRSAPSKKLNAY